MRKVSSSDKFDLATGSPGWECQMTVEDTRNSLDSLFDCRWSRDVPVFLVNQPIILPNTCTGRAPAMKLAA